jgi:hypothetical protein
MAAYTVNTYQVLGRVGLNQEIGTTSTTQKHELGERIRARDTATTSNRGEAEFIYLQGVAATVAGSVVVMNGHYATGLITARSKGPLAVATAAIVASNYGWYQIKGTAMVAAAAGVADNNPLYATGAGGVGTVSATPVVGDLCLNMVAAAATDTATILALIGSDPAMGDFDNA